MNSKKPIIVERSTQPSVKPQHRTSPIQESVTEPVAQPEVEQPEQPEPEVYLESLAEPPRDESIYGSGWSVTELMNEFNDR